MLKRGLAWARAWWQRATAPETLTPLEQRIRAAWWDGAREADGEPDLPAHPEARVAYLAGREWAGQQW